MTHTVLLVDDDAQVRHGLRRVLRHEPYEIVETESAAAALEILATRPIDLVVSDEQMPGMSGTDLLAHVRAHYPETMRMLLTGRGSFEVAVRAINAGEVYRFLTKPCDPVELAVAIRQGLQQKDLLHESRRLLHTVRRQSAVIAELEHEWKGLTHVDRDASGAVLLSDMPTDIDALLAEFQKEIAVVDARLRDHETQRRDVSGGSGKR